MFDLDELRTAANKVHHIMQATPQYACLGCGLEYHFRPEVKLDVMPWVARTGQGETDRGLVASLGGTF